MKGGGSPLFTLSTTGAAADMSDGNGNKKAAKSPSKDFVPVNDLEKKLARISTGRTTFVKAFNFLMNSMVIVAVKPAAEEGAGREKQLILRGPEGKPFLAVFSSPGRAFETLSRHKSYTQLVKKPGWQAMASLRPNRGLIVNPGSTVGFTVPPEELLKLRKKFRL
jgi:hypothetical protein